MAIGTREELLNPQNTDAERPGPSDEDPAVENLARESHVPFGAVEQLYVDELTKLTRSAHIKNFLSIFALRHVRNLLLERIAAKRGPVKPAGDPETGHPVPRHRRL